MEHVKRFFKDEEGIEFVEWAMMCAGFALVVWAALGPLSAAIIAFYGQIAAALA